MGSKKHKNNYGMSLCLSVCLSHCVAVCHRLTMFTFAVVAMTVGTAVIGYMPNGR